MRYFSLAVCAVVAFFMSTPVFAQDGVQIYINKCTQGGKAMSFCTCALDAFSDRLRKNDERDIPMRKMELDQLTSKVLNDPVMTQAKIDAVCDIHDEVQYLDRKAAIINRLEGHEQARPWTNKKVAAMEKKEALAMSYGASRETILELVPGNFCQVRYELNEMTQDQASKDTKYYPKLHRYLEAQPGTAAVNGQGVRAGCK